MILVPFEAIDPARYRPRYEEIASGPIADHYRVADVQITQSREGSDFLRRAFARTAARRRLAMLGAGVSCPVRSAAPNLNALNDAGRIVESLIDNSLFPDGIVSSAEGGIAVCFVKSDKYADIECHNDGDRVAVRYAGSNEPVAWTLRKSRNGIEDLVKTLTAFFAE